MLSWKIDFSSEILMLSKSTRCTAGLVPDTNSQIENILSIYG
uniref:Uncharacterized protein n=1 Tax=Rhizophora mucronata TaxID=61149 RepID=A0A2P2JA15_RHIMU